MVLTYKQLNDMAQKIVDEYRSPNDHPYINVDIEKLFKKLYNLKFKYCSLSSDDTILGFFSSVPMNCFVKKNGITTTIQLDGNTALIDESLLQDKFTGRRNFTVAHEGAHYILRHIPDAPWIAYRETIDKGIVTDWAEWQANTLASCLLMPENSVRYIFWSFYGSEHLEKITPFNDELFCPFTAMADYFGVSKQALAIRLQKMGLVDDIILSATISIFKED